MATPNISADFPYTSHYVDVHGSQIHYLVTTSLFPPCFSSG